MSLRDPSTVTKGGCSRLSIKEANRRYELRQKGELPEIELFPVSEAAFVAGKKCEWCGSTEKLLPHHPYKDTPDGIYEDLYLSECVVLCGTCHFMLERRHKVKCPVCRENWMPCDPTIDRCWPCHLKANPGKAEAIAAEKERRELADRQYKQEQAEKRKALKKKHPCKYRRVRGVCGKSPFKAQCQYSVSKALSQCGIAEPKGAQA